MNDYVLYHNPDVMGYPVGDDGQLSVLTDKPAKAVEGSRIWLLTGKGHPRTYYLCLWMVADHIGPDPNGRFATQIEGHQGRFLPKSQWPVLNDEPWFRAFRKRQGNFAFGLQPVGDPVVVAAFEQLAKSI